MGKMERPRQVQEARYHYDHDALVAMAKKSNRVQAEKKLLHEEAEEEMKRRQTEEATLKQAKELSLSPDGDILPPDQKVIDSLEEQ